MKKAFNKLHLRALNKNAKDKTVPAVKETQPPSLPIAGISNVEIQQEPADTSRSKSTGTTDARSNSEQQLLGQYDSRASPG